MRGYNRAAAILVMQGIMPAFDPKT